MNSTDRFSCIILCYDIERERSLESLEYGWFQSILEDPMGKDIPLALVACKSDSRKHNHDVISTNRGHEF